LRLALSVPSTTMGWDAEAPRPDDPRRLAPAADPPPRRLAVFEDGREAAFGAGDERLARAGPCEGRCLPLRLN